MKMLYLVFLFLKKLVLFNHLCTFFTEFCHIFQPFMVFTAIIAPVIKFVKNVWWLLALQGKLDSCWHL